MKTTTNVTINKDYLREIIKKCDSCSIDWLYYKHTVDLDELQQERDGRP